MQFVRSGRFSEAVKVLDALQTGRVTCGNNPLAQAVLADALQRTGENLRAQRIASTNVEVTSLSADVRARCYFVLGNVCRESGDPAGAIAHFEAAVNSNASDLELCCWAHLRLMMSVAEFEGVQTAFARLPTVRRTLTRFGDPRPFAVLHLWMVEIESTRGDLTSARRHLKVAKSLLAQIDDVWLQGYLAINSSGVSYYCAEIGEARRWADLAIMYAKASGHRGARRAAHANIGQIEFSAGNLVQAEEHYRKALECCEAGSSHQVSILDSIAHIKLHDSDIGACRAILKRIEDLTAQSRNFTPQHYTWPLQTKIQLLLKEGRTRDARRLSQELSRPIVERPQSRTSTVSHLLAVEAALADGDLNTAACNLYSIVSPGVQIPPDLFAEKERIVGGILGACQLSGLAKVHLERALRTFGTIGHELGKERVLSDLESLPNASAEDSADLAVKRALCRVSALLDTRTQPELFGQEAVSFLTDLGCTECIRLGKDLAPPANEQAGWEMDRNSSASPLSVDLVQDTGNRILLTYVPRREPASLISAFYFHRLIKQIVSLGSNDSTVDDCNIVWSSDDSSSTSAVVFAAESMFSILRTVSKIAPTDVSVLITGETGTGKEVIARRIHEHSTRASMRFSALNCALLPRELIESQLFGHRRGAFSGAVESFQGVIRNANGGTLFLDEIGEIPMDIQAKLLRFLEEGEIHPIGEAQPSKVNVRLIFATNGDLEEAVRQNRFRADLFYRLNVVPIKLPPLRDRREEIPLLVRLFSQRFGREFSKEPIRFSDAAMELLVFNSWPGNVRQLANEVRRLAALLDSGAYVNPDDLSRELHRPELERLPTPLRANVSVPSNQSLQQAVTYLEREMIERALKEAHGHVTSAAANLGLSRKGLYLKRRRLGITTADNEVR